MPSKRTSALPTLRARGCAIVAIAAPPLAPMRSTRRGGLEVALHRLNEAAEHPPGRRRAYHRAGDVADVAAAARRQQREPDQCRERRTAMGVWQTGDLPWPAQPHRAAEHALHVVRDVLELGAATGQHDLAS